MDSLLALIYTVGFVVLGLLGARALIVTIAYVRVRRRIDEPTAAGWQPVVTVQLPVYNERYVAARVIDAACALHWPRDLLEIQVLDDSTDDTRDAVDAAAGVWRARGTDVKVVRRGHRDGFKAGALAEGLGAARGEVIAVFDADFVPPADFLESVVPHLGPRVAAVQARWGHLNADASGLTRAQALALDGHFIVEQTARSRLGLFLNFNGTAGVWRREAIDDAGGWQHDTLSEDVDLSYRAQLAGWRIVFLRDVVVPGEVPTTLLAFKRQQRRWAMGTTQVLRKLGVRLLRGPHPLRVRAHALLSLASHIAHPASLGLFLFAPLLLAYHPRFHAALGILTVVTLFPPLMYAVATYEIGERWWRRLSVYPLLLALSVGMSASGTVAVASALAGRQARFERTPKAGDAATSGYGMRVDRLTAVEALLAAYGWAGLVASLHQHATGMVVFFGLFACGFTLVAALSLDGRSRRPVAAGEATADAG